MSSTNIPLGTYVQDGVRSGPFYTGQLSGFVADTNGVLTSSSHDTYGPGVLFSPMATYDIVPFQFNPAGGFTSLNNVVAVKNNAAVPAAGYLPLRADGYVTTAIINADGTQGLQLDWPRVITVTVATANATAGTRVTVFGTDFYGMPMQHTYVIEAQGNYPTVNAGPPIVLTVPGKAFFTVTKVYISAAIPAAGGCTVSLGASNIFGLPYYAKDIGAVAAVGWGGASELCVVAEGDPLTTLGVLVGGAGNASPNAALVPATAITGDVRGLYGPSSIPDGVKNLTFTYYVRGGNTFLNQAASMNWPQYNAVTAVPGVVPPLNPTNLYGVPQFYTGVPS